MTRSVQGSGVFSTAAGDMNFDLNEPQVETEISPLGIAASAEAGGTVSLIFDGDTVIAYYQFMTDYGKNLSPQERANEVQNRAPEVSYEEATSKIYINEWWTARR